MNVALGFKSHSGWAALVAIGRSGGELEVIERRRIELIDEGELWAKQPYHAAEELGADEAHSVVEKGIESAHRVSLQKMKETIKRMDVNHHISACAVLMPSPMPDWTTEEILAVHFRMHKAEGVLFPDALCRAAAVCGLPLLQITEKRLEEHAETVLSVPLGRTRETVEKLGKSVGPPWGRDQKYAAIAAIIALQTDRNQN